MDDRKDFSVFVSMVPSEIDNELIQMGEGGTERSFRIGEIANQLAEAGRNIKKDIVYAYVASRCGEAKRTVREFAETEIFFHGKWRSYEILSYNHFRQAFKHRKTNWEEMLMWAVEQIDEKGVPAPVDSMVANFATPKENKPDPIEKLVKRLDNLIDDMMVVVSPTTSAKIWEKGQEIIKLVTGKEEVV
jgi:hypothetical protein